MTPPVRVFDDADGVSRAGAEDFVSLASAAIAARGRFTVAREVRILVAGPDKTARLREVLQGPYDPERLPVQLVQPEAGRLVWLVDRAAAGALDMVGSVR